MIFFRLSVLLVCNFVIWSPFRFRKCWRFMVVMFVLRRYQTSLVHDLLDYVLTFYYRDLSFRRRKVAKSLSCSLPLPASVSYWRSFFGYRTLYIDIKDGELSLTSVGIVSLLLVFLLGVAYKVLKFMGLICWRMVIMQCCGSFFFLTVVRSGLFLFFWFTS